jgi:anti-sigma regulatory factor (Ser/Thr protein kinase)
VVHERRLQKTSRIRSTVQGQRLALEAAELAGMSRAVEYITNGSFLLLLKGPVPIIGREFSEQVILRDVNDVTAARELACLYIQQAKVEERYGVDFLLALVELATNAVEHAKEGRVRFYQTETSLGLRVQDKGSGIPTDRLARCLFGQFESTGHSLGMGLSIVHALSREKIWFYTSTHGTTWQYSQFRNSRYEDESRLAILHERVARMILS